MMGEITDGGDKDEWEEPNACQYTHSKLGVEERITYGYSIAIKEVRIACVTYE